MEYLVLIEKMNGSSVINQTFASEVERDKFYDGFINGTNPILSSTGEKSLSVIKIDVYKGHRVEIGRNIIYD